MLPPLSATEIKQACQTGDKQQMLKRNPDGAVEPAGTVGWAQYLSITAAPEGVETMVSEYNQYLRRHQELENMAAGKPLSERKVELLSGPGECLVSRFEDDLSVLENSPAFQLHEAEIDFERCLMRCSSKAVHDAEVQALAQELTNSATTLFHGKPLKLAAYIDELLGKLNHYNDGASAAAYEELQTKLAPIPLIHQFETKQTAEPERKTVKQLAVNFMQAVAELFAGARDSMKTFFDSTLTTLSQLVKGHEGKEKDLATVKEILQNIHPSSATPLETLSVTTEPVDEDDDFETPQSTLTASTVSEAQEKTEPPGSSPDTVSPFEEIDPTQALNWQAMQLAADRLREEERDTSSTDELENEMPNLQELKDEDPLVRQSLYPSMGSLQLQSSLPVATVEEEPSILRSVINSLAYPDPEPHSLVSSFHSFQSPYPTRDTEDKLNSFIDDERLLDGLDEETTAEVQQEMLEQGFLAGLHQELSLPSEPGSPTSLEDTDSPPPMSLVPLTSLSQPVSIAAAPEHKGAVGWRFANPLSPANQALAEKTWNDCVVEEYGEECMMNLPDFERRRLQTTFYHLCLNSEVPPTKADLKAALEQHRSAIEQLFPSTCGEVRKQPGSAKTLITHDLAACVQLHARSLNLSPATIEAMTEAATLMGQCVHALASSPYDDAQEVTARKEQLIELKRQLAICRGPFDQIPGRESGNPSMIDLHMPMERDLDSLHKQLDEQIEVMNQLIENDFSQHRNLVSGQQRLLKGALKTVQAEMKTTENARRTAKVKKVKKALKSKLDGLALLEGAYNRQLSELSADQTDNRLEADIVQQLHDFKHRLGSQLKAAQIGSEAINRGLQDALNSSTWLPVTKHYVMAS